MKDIMSIIIQMIANIPITLINIQCWNKCYGTDIRDNKKASIIAFIINFVVTAIFNYTMPKSIRIFAIFILLITVSYFYLTKKISESILLVGISELIIWFSEFTFVLIASIFLKNDIYEFVESINGFIVLNIHMVIISFLVLKSKVPVKLYNKIKNTISSLKNNETIVYLVMLILIIIITTIESHMRLPMPIILTTNMIMGIVFIIILLSFTSVKSRYNMINNKYQTSLSSLREYEMMIDKFRIINHENKNELLTIRNMSKNKKVTEHIDKLIDNKIKDNEKIMSITSKIPEGGLRATIYSKLCLMDKYNIKYKLDIAKDVKTVDLIDMNEELIVNICRILGVFLDNAIEAVDKLKDKTIEIELYLIDNDLYIDITNNFEGIIDLKKIENTNYTTKGNGHGYGLLLVNKIIKESNNKLKNEKTINGKCFTQTLKIRM